MTDNNAFSHKDATALQVAKALAAEHASVYCIDVNTGKYEEFASTEPYKYLGIPPRGSDFFFDSHRNVARVVHADDIDRVRSALERDYLLSTIRQEGSLQLSYRLILDGEPIYVRMKATLSEDGQCIIVSITDIDKLVRIEELRQRERDEKLEFLQVASNLARRHERMFLVDLATDDYYDFTASTAYGDKVVPPVKHGFFEVIADEVRALVHPDDLDAALMALAKESLVKSVRANGPYRFDFNALAEEGQMVKRLSAQLTDNRKALIVGIDDISEELARVAEDEEIRHRSKLYGQIASSLASEYATIYYIDVYTKHYIEFAASDVYRDLGAPTSGDDFFADSRENIVRVIYPEDLDIVMNIMDRDVMTTRVNEEGSLSVTYRLMLGGKPVYTRLHAVWALDHRHLILGVADVDAEMRMSNQRKEVEERNRIYGYIAQSLANQYATIFYVDVYTESYIEFASSDIYKQLEVQPTGDKFFDATRENVQRVIHPDDRDLILSVFDRDTLTGLINEQGAVSLTYRLIIDGESVYTSLRAVWADDMRHLIIGVSDVDAQMKKELAQQEAQERSLTYAHIARSLADRYDSIYYVDAVTSEFTEYASTEEYRDLNVKAEGDDFFAESAKSIRELVYEEDKEYALNAISKESLLSALSSDGVFSTNYRLMFGDTPTFINLRAVWAEDHRHLIVGIANVDAEVKREREHAERLRQAHEKAMRDELTGIRNQNAFAEVETQIARDIEAGTQPPFAFVACDVNGLKDVNDNLGHKAGDDYIRAACTLICDTYTHSPVFRTGGDEFVVVLRGSDYANRNTLLEEFRATVHANQGTGDVIVATGMSAYKPGVDLRPSDVFARADALMYENKKTLKGARL